jgi:N-acetyl-gamma-glutamyl-phosphate reductase
MKQVGILGGSGYTGAELLRLLTTHPDYEVKVVTGDSMAGQMVHELYPSLALAYPNLTYQAMKPEFMDGLDAVFCALPHGISQTIVPKILDNVGHIIDLGSDFRLKDPQAYVDWYLMEHACPEYLANSIYGLPELFRDEIRGGKLIAATGCNAAASILSLAPFLKEKVIESTSIVINLITGVSGAGKPPKDNTTFCAVDENVTPYGLLTHRHTPEIEQALSDFSAEETMNRGIIATSYGKVTDSLTTQKAIEILHDAYGHEPFIYVSENPPSTKATLGSNAVHITARVDERTQTLISIVTLDNLVKGASGMAIQNANIAMEIEETLGLPIAGLYP